LVKEQFASGKASRTIFVEKLSNQSFDQNEITIILFLHKFFLFATSSLSNFKTTFYISTLLRKTEKLLTQLLP